MLPLLLSFIPFPLTGIATAVVAQQRLFPALASDGGRPQSHRLPTFTPDTPKPSTYSLGAQLRRPSAQNLASFVFSASIGLSTVLVELLLCDISNTLNPAARGLALRLTLTSLLVFSILVTPALEIHGFAKTLLGTPTDTISTRRTKPRLRIALETTLFAAWLLTFWYLPQASILRTALQHSDDSTHLETPHAHAFTEACLERIGIIGISLMASLSGFAAVSSLWQTFGVRHRLVRETDISRKEAGLAATDDMLAAKHSRLRALQRRMSEAAASTSNQKPAGFMGRMLGSLRGSTAETQEVKALEMEVSGLSTMHAHLASTLSTLRTRHAAQHRAHTPLGKLLHTTNALFALYCAYRILATLVSTLRRWWQPAGSAPPVSDPINNLLALLTTHYDTNLDRAAWARQISFLLSGAMLLASGSAVLQTSRLFARFAPRALQQHATQQTSSLPLVISQIAGTYVISSALLLRSNLPKEVGGVISEALGKPLEGGFVEGWFERWFLVGVGVTAGGILVGRKIGGGGEGWEDDWEDEWEGGAGGKRR
ncbi:hypothetical protein LTR08_003250 [Meristemomyces frigidus]|nr:hypothetical protein LTR08_003250 [Meristemomyces frigidus]